MPYQPLTGGARYPRFAQCLSGGTLAGRGGAESYNLDCISCSSVVTVDPARGSDCISRPGNDLDGSVCNDLDPVLESIMLGHTTSTSCIEVSVMPKAVGKYVVLARGNQAITQSVLLRGRSETDLVDVSIEEPSASGGNTSLYGLRFNNSDGVIFNRIRFLSSTGILGFDGVQLVVIVESSFRFFAKGAVDAYNSPTVLVAASNFSHNTATGIIKMEAYRGHSAGLSISYNQNTGTSLNPLVRILDCRFRNNSVDVTPIGSTMDSDQSGFSSDQSESITEDGVLNVIPVDSNNNNNSNGNNNNNNNGGNGRPPRRNVSNLFIVRGQAFSNQVFSGRGGGAAFLINSLKAADVVLWKAMFLENSAIEFGGGAYLLLQGDTSHSITINQSRFDGNTSPSTGGGLHTTFLLRGINSESHRLLISDSTFTRNEAMFGGGVFFLVLELTLFDRNNIRLGGNGRFENCMFSRNDATEAGGALGVAFNKPLFSLELTRPLEILDCNFIFNSVHGAGIVSTAFFPVTFRGQNRFSNNTGPSLGVIGSLVRVFGRLDFVNNSNSKSLDGGSLYFTTMGQMELQDGSSLLLKDNSGIVGAAIVIQNIQLSSILSKLRYNPLCSFLFHDQDLSPRQWADRNVSVSITGNVAVVSSGVFLNNIDFCSWSSNSPPYFRPNQVFRWSYINYRSNVNRAHGNPREQGFAVQTPAIRLRLRNGTSMVRAFPGESIAMAIFAHDEFGVSTSTVVGFVDDSQSSFSLQAQNKVLYQFSPSTATLNRVSPDTRVMVKFGVSETASSFPIEQIRVRTLGEYAGSSETKLTLNPNTCPAGYRLDDGAFQGKFSSCSCDLARTDIVECNDRLITMKDLHWGYTDNLDGDFRSLNLSNFRTSDPFNTFACPHGYCNCRIDNSSGTTTCSFIYDGMSPNSQCLCNREGILCGDCVNGTGFSALLNNCVSCDDFYTFLLLLLVIVNVAAIFIILLLMFPIPAWVYPIVFYLQILPAFTKQFPVSFERLSPYMEYISSALGMYFPYDFCLHSDMTASGVYALRYIPAVLASIITPVFLFIRSKKFRSIDWHGVWLLILLLYTPVVHTSMVLLDCPHLQGETPFTPRWFINANIKCFRDPQHAPLGMFAIGILACSMAVIILLTLIAMQKLSKPEWVQHLVVPLTLPFKDSCGWWCGIELGKRIVLILFAVGFKDNSVVLTLIMAILLSLIGFFKPFKSMFVNILDMVYGITIFIMLCFRSTVDLEIDLQSEAIELNTTSECATNIQYTNFVILLGVLYYVPLIIAVAVLLWYLTWQFVTVVRKDVMPMMGKKESPPHSPLDESIGTPQRSRTQTVVDISSCEAATPVVHKQFSFEAKKPIVRLASRKLNKKRQSKQGSGHEVEIPLKYLTEFEDTIVKAELEEPIVSSID